MKSALVDDSEEAKKYGKAFYDKQPFSDNDELWYDDHFGRYATYVWKYDEGVWVEAAKNPFEGSHPNYPASRIPAIDDDKVLPYIALQVGGSQSS